MFLVNPVFNNLIFVSKNQSSRLSRAELQNLDTLIKQQASKLQGKVTISLLVEWLVEYCSRYEEAAICRAPNPMKENDIDSDYTVVAQLDHIRSKTIYLKTLSQWFRELDLHGVLISYRKWIFLMVSGKKDSLQVLCVVQTSLIDQLIH